MKPYLKVTLLAAAFLLTLQSCKKEEDEPVPSATTTETELKAIINENGNNPDESDVRNNEDERRRLTAVLYTQSNASAQNEIMIFRQHRNGALTLAGTVPSGGPGTGTGLGSQSAVTLSENREWLFAVNAGDNTLSAFHIGPQGALTLTSTTSSMGVKPVSITSRHNLVYVVNSTSANIAGFEMSSTGILTHIAGSVQALSSTTAAPAQISFTPGGGKLTVTEKMTNKIAVFELNMGVAQPGTFINSTGITPFGFDFAQNFMIVSNASGGSANASSLTSYTGMAGVLTAVSGPVPNNQTAACWVATTHHGRFAFVTNAGSNTISSYYVGHNGNLHLVAGNAASTGNSPIDITVAPNNFFVYALCSADNSIFVYRRNLWGTLNPLGSVQGLPTSASGLVMR